MWRGGIYPRNFLNTFVEEVSEFEFEIEEVEEGLYYTKRLVQFEPVLSENRT